eukprot:jgi/Bigna1/67932/fgenesh1_pg.5_\
MGGLKCWKCLGNKRKYNKKTKRYDGAICGVCSGTGTRRPSKRALNDADRPGVVKKLRRTRFPGPPAHGSGDKGLVLPSVDLVGKGEILGNLGCGNWRIFQLAAGHKLTVDDFICAWVAAREMRDRGYGGPAFGQTPILCPSSSKIKKFRHADIGCGCGSVLMTLAWAFPGSVLSFGVEAQKVSFNLLQRGLLWNLGSDGSEEKDAVRVANQDLRSWDGGGRAPYDLVTGTPPYFAKEKFPASANHAQKIRCRIPTRGAAVDYVDAAESLLAPGGVFVMVEAAHRESAEAVETAVAKHALLQVKKRIDIIPRVGLPPRFSCWVITKANDCEIDVGGDGKAEIEKEEDNQGPERDTIEPTSNNNNTFCNVGGASTKISAQESSAESKEEEQQGPTSASSYSYEVSEMALRLGRSHGFKRAPEYVSAMESMGWINFEGGGGSEIELKQETNLQR